MPKAVDNRIKVWFENSYNWQKDLFNKLYRSSELSTDELNSSYMLLLKEFNLAESDIASTLTIPLISIDSDELKSSNTILKQLANVKGVGGLSASSPLNFNQGLNVVYGVNGCGKSSYIRLLKNICKSKGTKPLIGNIFEKENLSASAEIVIQSEDSEQSHKWHQHQDNATTTMEHFQVYDSDCAAVYISEDNEVYIEPEILHVYTKMISIYDKHASEIILEQKHIQQQLVIPPDELKTSEIIIKYLSASNISGISAIEKDLQWNDAKETILANLDKALNASNPLEVAKRVRGKISAITTISKQLLNLCDIYSNEKCESLLTLKNMQISSQKAAEDAATKIFSSSNLNGVGKDTWKALWEAARTYSEQIAYSKQRFPNIESDAVCVLCHQPLSADAKHRIKEFESFVKSSLECEAQLAQDNLSSAIKKFDNIPDSQIVRLTLEAGDVDEEIIVTTLEYFSLLEQRRNSLLLETDFKNITQNIEHVKTNKYYTELIASLNDEAKMYEDASADYEKQKEQYLKLRSLKWLYYNKNNIKLKKKLLLLEKAHKSTNTKSLSVLKSDLADMLITEHYISLFRQELFCLGASNIQVDLVKSKTTKGKVTHKIALKNTHKMGKAKDILSEGESRVVSLAAFLSDINSISSAFPFIFDDPISSLDHVFEENVAKRLVELSNERQVIVFTHRIAFVYLLKGITDKAKKNCNLISLRKSPLGEPDSSFSMEPLKMKSQVRIMIDRTIPRIRRKFDEKDFSGYDQDIRALCSDVRIMVEGGIENTLLRGIVLRFNRNISTLKLKQLKSMTYEDIDVFDNLMTKYSKYEHSQALELSQLGISLDEIEEDLKSLFEWISKYEKKV